jgi:hypothetical protein
VRRRAFTIFAAGSAVIFLAATGWWVRGFFANDMYLAENWDAGQRQLVERKVQFGGGRVIYFQFAQTLTPHSAAGHGPQHVGPWTHQIVPAIALAKGWAASPWYLVGYSYLRGYGASILSSGPHFDGSWYVGIRLLAAMCVCAILPGRRLFQILRRRRRHASGRCTHCGYDLRATPEGGAATLEVCPECGEENAVAKISNVQR